LTGIHRQEGQAGVKLLPAGVAGTLSQGSEPVVCPAPVRGELIDDGGNTGCVGCPQCVYERPSLEGTVHSKPTPGQQGDQAGDSEGPQSMDMSGPAHYAPLRLGPVLAAGQNPDPSPLRDRRQVAVLRLGVPEGCALGQQELGPPSTG